MEKGKKRVNQGQKKVAQKRQKSPQLEAAKLERRVSVLKVKSR